MILSNFMKKDFYNIYFYLTIFLTILIIAYPVSYILIKTPYYSCSEYFPYLKNWITEVNDPIFSNCIKIEENDIKEIFHIFLYWFISFFIFFYFFNKILNLQNLNFFFQKFKINSDLLYYFVIVISPIFYFLGTFINFGKFNFIFLLNNFVFYYLTFFFFIKNKKIFLIFSLFFLIPVFFGEISNVIHLMLIFLYIAVFRELSLKNIFKSLIIFLSIFVILISTQDFFKTKYGFSDFRKYNIVKTNGKYKFFRNLSDGLSDDYVLSQFDYNKRKIYFKLDNYIPTDYLRLVYNRLLGRLSEINHTVIVKKLFDTNNAETLNGRTYERLPVILIPRIIYPNKPSESYGNVLICHFGIASPYRIKDECYKKNTTSINLNVILEGYINYKIPGLFFSSFLISFLAALAFSLIRTSKFYLNIFGICILYQSIMYQSNLSGVFGGVLICIIGVIPLMLLKRINET